MTFNVDQLSVLWMAVQTAEDFETKQACQQALQYYALATTPEILAHIAKLETALQADGWRDISSAPRDGTRVLLMLRGPKPPEMIARWAQEWTTEEGDDAFEWVNDEDDAIYGTPTHWAPLPPPPGEKP
jgi:hypothetical protein